MVCKNCSFENEENVDFCANCGAPMSDEAAEVEAAENEVIVTEDVIEETVYNEEPDDLVPPSCGCGDEDGDGDDEDKKKSPMAAILTIAAVIVVCVVAGVLLFNSSNAKYDLPVDRSGFDVTYMAENQLYIKPLSGEANLISDALAVNAEDFANYESSYNIVQSRDGKAVYFLEAFDSTAGTGTLCVSYNSKDKIEIATGVPSGFIVSRDGSTVLYMTGLDTATNMGTLNAYKKNAGPQVITESTRLYFYSCNDNGAYIGYTTNINSETMMGELWRLSANGESVKIDDNSYRANRIYNDGSMLYLKDVDTTGVGQLYFYNGKTASAELVSEGVYVNAIVPSQFSTKFAYAPSNPDNPSSLDLRLKVPGGADTLIMDNIYDIVKYDVENENFLLSKMNATEEETELPDSLMLKRRGQEVTELSSSIYDNAPGSASPDFRTIVYITDVDEEKYSGNLMMMDGQNTSMIAENVFYFKTSSDCRTIAYFTENAETQSYDMYIYKNGNTKQIASNVLASTVVLSDNGEKIFYVTDYDSAAYTGTLSVSSTSGNEEPTVIDTGVYPAFSSRNQNNVFYKKNIDVASYTDKADIYMWDGKGSTEIGKNIQLLFD